jgi:hypothetical protein
VIDGAGNAVSQVSTFRRNLGGWSSWQPYPIEQPQDVGRYVDVNSGDIDRDGKVDLVFSYSHATGQLSGVVWMRNLGSVFSPVWERNEISGAPGTKFDNVELLDVDGDGDLDAVTSEQTEQLGVVWYENPVVP